MKTCSQQHARGFDLDGGDIVFSGDGLDLTVFSLVTNGCSLCIGIHCVQQTHGDASVLGGLDAGRVQDLRSKVSQLCSLLEMQLVHRLGFVNHTRVVVMHTVDIGPDLNLLCVNGFADE